MKTIYLSGTVGYEITADTIREQVDFKSREKLRMIVNSYGGYVSDAFEIYNLLQTYRGEIEAVIMGVAASAMSYIVMAADKISAFKNSIFMAHLTQNVAVGTAYDMAREAEIMSAMDGIIADSYIKRMGGSREEIIAKMKDEIWLVGWEALTEAGMIDNVIDKPDEIEIPEPDKDEDQLMILVAAEFDRNAATARARMGISQVFARMRRDEDRARTDSERMAAYIKPLDQTPAGPGKDKINMEVSNMTLKEFLAANPEAQAEYEKDILAAEEKGKAGASNDIINTERTRIVNILKLAGAEMSESAIMALEKNMTPEAFAVSELERIKGERQESTNANPNPFGVLKPKATAEKPTGVDAPSEDLDAFEDRARAAARKLKGGK
jgi:ATP-dependent protease ClpP protease subunit